MAVQTVNSLKQMVKAKAERKGLGFLWPLIDYIVTNESSWNPSVQSSATDPGTGRRENSWGLFQNLIDSSMGPGLGANYTPEQLQDPEINAEIALEHIRKQLAAGIPLQQAVDDWAVTHSIDVANLVQGGEITMAGQISPTAMPGYTPLSAPTQTPTEGPAIPSWVDALLEEKWNDFVSQEMARIQAESQQTWASEKDLEQEAEMSVRALYGPKDYWKAVTAQSDFGVNITPAPEDTDEWNRALEELTYQVEVKKWPVEKAAAEFANRISAATAGGTLAQTAEQIRTSQMGRRMPAPNVPGGYQPIDPAQFTKYGMTAPQPVPVQPGAFPDPWAEMERGMAAVGPTALPEMEFPPFPGGGGESAIIQAYNAITGGGAPTPTAQPMGPTPDALTRGMFPASPPPPNQSMGPMMTPAMMSMAPQPTPQAAWQPGMTSPPPMPWQLWEELYGGR